MKTEILCRLMDVYNPKLSMVFCNTKKRDELTIELQEEVTLPMGFMVI